MSETRLDSIYISFYYLEVVKPWSYLNNLDIMSPNSKMKYFFKKYMSDLGDTELLFAN